MKRVSLNGVCIPKPKTEDAVKVFQSIETIAKTPFAIYLRIELTQNDQDADDNKMNLGCKKNPRNKFGCPLIKMRRGQLQPGDRPFLRSSLMGDPLTKQAQCFHRKETSQ